MTLTRGYQPGIVIVDAGYGNNTSFLLELEKGQLKYLGGLAKNRKVTVNDKEGWLGLKEYQVRDKRSLTRYFILVFCAYTFILWHQMTGGLRQRWANKTLNTFTEANNAFKTAMSFRFFDWLTLNRHLFAS